MSNPYSPNQQPVGGNGQYPAGQQYTQQMPVAGGYQQQGYVQQPQQGYYPQGQFQGAPSGGQPAKKKTGLIIGIIAAVLVVLIAAGVAIWWFVYNKDSSDDAAAQSTPSTAAPTSAPSVAPSPSAPVAPAPAPSQSAPPAGTNPSAPGGGSESDKEKQAIAECTKEINNDYTNANVSDAKLELMESYGETRWWDYTGTVSGTSTLTNKPITTRFTCSVFYFEDEKDFSAVVIPENY